MSTEDDILIVKILREGGSLFVHPKTWEHWSTMGSTRLARDAAEWLAPHVVTNPHIPVGDVYAIAKRNPAFPAFGLPLILNLRTDIHYQYGAMATRPQFFTFTVAAADTPPPRLSWWKRFLDWMAKP